MLRQIWLILFIVILLPGMVMAQDATNTPQPEQAYILSWSQEVIFPQAIRFSIILSRPLTDISAATLSVQPEGQTPRNSTLDLEEAAVKAEPYTELAYIWEIPAAAPPQLFAEIEFGWQISGADNQNARITDRFVFTDERSAWLPNIEILDGFFVTLPVAKSDEKLEGDYSKTSLANLESNLADVYDLLRTNLESVPSFNLIVYNNELLPGCTTNAENQSVTIGPVSDTEVPCDPEIAGSIIDGSNYTLLTTPSPEFSSVESTVIDYITRGAYAARWVGKFVPEWFQYGIVQLYAPVSKAGGGLTLVNAARTNSLISLDDMAEPPSAGVNVDLWRAQSYGMALYIAAQIGTDGLLNLARDIREASSFADAYESAIGRSLESLMPDFGRWIFTDTAQSAFNFTLYQPPTPMPTATRTSTSTPTPTFTYTPTITPSATVTGFLSNTPRPTLTPSRTLTPRPPTFTPRPPGSLNTPTPAPVQTTGSSNPVITGLLLFIIVVLIVVILALVVLRIRARRR